MYVSEQIWAISHARLPVVWFGRKRARVEGRSVTDNERGGINRKSVRRRGKPKRVVHFQVSYDHEGQLLSRVGQRSGVGEGWE